MIEGKVRLLKDMRAPGTPRAEERATAAPPEAGSRKGDAAEPGVRAVPMGHLRALFGKLAAGLHLENSPLARIIARVAEPDLQHSLALATSGLRWMGLLMLLVIALIQPKAGRIGLTNWQLILVFAAYNLGADFFMAKGKGRRPLLWRSIIDLPLAALIYFCSSQPGSPQFDLVFLAVLCTAVNLRLHDSLMYSAAAVIITAMIEPTLPQWVHTSDNVRGLGMRLVILALAGTGTAIMAHLLRQQQEQTSTARRETQRLEQIDRQREDFIASITHDLRTPFTAVRAGLGMVQMSVADRMRPEEQHLLVNVSRNTDRLGLLINDLLAFNQVEAGALRLDRRPLDLAEVVDTAASGLQPLLEEKQQTLELQLQGPLPHLGDGKKLEQVVVNLLDNAHRHTPRGTRITVSGQVSGDEVLVTIRDNGPGIPPQECEAIFERFHRVDLGEGGWGLGLTIAQAITEKHGGRIWVDSQFGKGAAFHVALPIYKEDALSLEQD